MNTNSLLSERVITSVGANDKTAGTSEQLSAVLDMQGFDGARFLVHLGDCADTAVVTLAVKENTANSTSSPTPSVVALTSASAGSITTGTAGTLTLTATATNLDDKIIVIDVKRHALSKRYLFLSVSSATANYSLNSIIAEKYAARDIAVSQSSDVYSYAYAAS